ncbi:60S ribosomal protein L28-like [Uloborus diversus]|uniref:60S ribosomal protein L28-like n=1 Tax=Uloborus diversus TaxID=327109 RepID=UPI0024090C4F|nr:60S ribosomal protein L28-like [Uloborus diversus]
MSSHLTWMIIRNRSSFMIKKRNVKKYFNSDPLNMKNIHSPRFCGLVQKKAIMVEPHAQNNGVNLVFKKARHQNRPVKALQREQLTRNARRTMTVIKKFVKQNKYRKDLKMLALRRASAILKSQRHVVPKKKVFKKKAE